MRTLHLLLSLPIVLLASVCSSNAGKDPVDLAAAPAAIAVSAHEHDIPDGLSVPPMDADMGDAL